MSELTTCNLCALRAIRQRAKASGMVVTLRPSDFLGGTDVYVHKPGEPISEKNSVAWMMKIGDKCEC